MRIDKKKMIFVELTATEAKELRDFAVSVVLKGSIPHPLPAWVGEWMREFNYDDRQELLMLSTAFPQRVLLSVVNYLEELIDPEVFWVEGYPVSKADAISEFSKID